MRLLLLLSRRCTGEMDLELASSRLVELVRWIADNERANDARWSLLFAGTFIVLVGAFILFCFEYCVNSVLPK